MGKRYGLRRGFRVSDPVDFLDGDLDDGEEWARVVRGTHQSVSLGGGGKSKPYDPGESAEFVQDHQADIWKK